MEKGAGVQEEKEGGAGALGMCSVVANPARLALTVPHVRFRATARREVGGSECRSCRGLYPCGEIPAQVPLTR